MKVCLVYSSGISTTKGGGIATKIQNLVKQTSDRVDYTLLTSADEYARVEGLEKLGSEIVYFPAKQNFLDYYRIYRKLSKINFDVIHFQELPFMWDIKFGILLSVLILNFKIKKAGFVYEHQIATAGNLNILHITLQSIIFKSLYNLWNTVIVNSKYMLDEAVALGKVDSSKISLVPLGVDLERINQASPKALEGPSLVFFGHTSRIKGIDLAVEALKILHKQGRKVHLYIVGNGDLRIFCERYVEKENLTEYVHFLGSKPQDVLFRIIKGADICLLPSRNDSGPLTVLESMAAGKPIITTRVGIVSEMLVNYRNCILVEKDSSKIVVAVNYLLNNPAVMQKMGRNNLADILNFSWKRVCERYVLIYKSIIKQKSK